MFKKILKSILCVFIFGFLIQISGCKNFMQGSQVLTEINDTISYENAPYVNASIVKENLDDTGTLEPSGKVSDAKVGFPFTITYTPSSNYYFEQWQALDENNNPVSNKIVHFENPGKLKTEVTINTKEYIKIQAINKTTPRVNIKLSVNLADSGKINLEKIDLEEGESKAIRFIENERFQFIKWECSNSDVIIDDTKSIDTVVSSKVSKKTGSFSAEIVAVCAERPQVVSSNTMNQTETFFKNTSLTINFNKQLSAKNDLSKIKLIYSGIELLYGETEAFNEPYFYDDGEKINYSVVIIPANKNHSLNVEQTGQIKVEIPEDFYYEDVNNKNEKILFGEKFSWVYKINNETNEKTNIQLEYNSDHGKIIEGASGIYNIGKTLQYTYEVNDDSMFICWEIIQAPSNIIKISDSKLNSKNISFTTINNGDVTVKAKTVKRPALDSNYAITPANKESGVEIDSDVSMKFNCAVNVDSIINNIKIECDDEDISDFFDINFDTSTNKLELTASEDPVTIIKYKNKLEPTENKTKKVKITISKDDLFFYNDNTKVIAANDIEYKYAINNKTTKVASIKINKDTSFGNYSGNDSGTYYLGDKVSLTFTENKNYQFKDFKIIQKNSVGTDSTNIIDYKPITTESDKKVFDATVLNSGTVEISIDAVERIQVDEEKIVPKYLSTGVSKDSSIYLYFTKAVKKEQFEENSDLISITDGNNNYNNNFLAPIISNDGKEIYIKPNYNNLINLGGASKKELSIVLSAEIIDSEQKTTLGKDFKYKYIINDEKDSKVPEFSECILYKTSDKKNVLNFTNKDIGEDIDNITDSTELKKYSISDYVYFDLDINDLGSGLKNIIIQETKIKTLSGTELVTPKTEKAEIFNYEEEDDDIENQILYWNKTINSFENNENNKITLKYKLKSEEGVIKLSVKAYDNADNFSEKIITIIHNKNKLDSSIWILTNAPEHDITSVDDYNNKTTKIRWYNLGQVIYKDFVESDKSFKCELIFNGKTYSSENNEENKCTYDEDNKYWWVDVGKTLPNTDNIIELIVTSNDKTEIVKKEYIIPKTPTVIYAYYYKNTINNKTSYDYHIIMEQNYLLEQNNITVNCLDKNNKSILTTNNINNISLRKENSVINQDNLLFIYYGSKDEGLYSGITDFNFEQINSNKSYSEGSTLNNVNFEQVNENDDIKKLSFVLDELNIKYFTVKNSSGTVLGNYSAAKNINLLTADLQVNEKLSLEIFNPNRNYLYTKKFDIILTKSEEENEKEKKEDSCPPKVNNVTLEYYDDPTYLYYLIYEVQDINEIDKDNTYYYFTNNKNISNHSYKDAIEAGITYKPEIIKDETKNNTYILKMKLYTWFDILYYRVTITDINGNKNEIDTKSIKFPEVDLFYDLSTNDNYTIYTNSKNYDFQIQPSKMNLQIIDKKNIEEINKSIKDKEYKYCIGATYGKFDLCWVRLKITADDYTYTTPYKCLNFLDDKDNDEQIINIADDKILVQTQYNMYYKVVYSKENFENNFFEWENCGYVISDSRITGQKDNVTTLISLTKDIEKLEPHTYYTVLFYLPYNKNDVYKSFYMTSVGYKE